ncbi:fibropellin-1-like isoform X2 [Mya arenaria]|uniref:fibropellin-1-like isoform X2 n=1 Tax=Mya arenaria TaxID=6604 RepID=UPI0022E4ED46|nr:fibropellin-1-like isoform X2 [Mya arenaria]
MVLLISIMFLSIYMAKAQIGQTECATLAYSVCDTIITQKCVCVTSQGFTTNANDDGCDYDCGVLSEPNNGAVSYKSTIQDSVAMYGCHAGFQIDGVTRRTCSVVKPKGWSGVAPSCIAGQLGDLCNTITDLCDNIINGECSVLGICSCLAGYEAVSFFACQEINECASNPCINGGTCNDLVNEFTCTCATGFKGITCQTNDCNTLPCQNGGACTDRLATYTCACTAGFEGINCEINIDECASSPCGHGGSCSDGIDFYTCNCVAGYTGLNCQTDIDDCASQPCLNEGTCLEGVAQFACACVQGYSGSLCQDGVGDKAVQTLTIITAISSLVTVVLLTIGGIAIACTRKRGKAVQSHKEQNFMMSSARDSRDIENVSQIMDYEVLGNRDSNNADRRSYQDLHGINKT